MFLRESKSKMLAQLSQDKLDHEKIVEELKTQLKYTEEKCKLEIETCQVDCMSKLKICRKSMKKIFVSRLQIRMMSVKLD